MNSFSKNETEMNMEMKNPFKNEQKNEHGNEPKMNEAIEMNDRNELEMNILDQIKRNCYPQTLHSMGTIKLVTDEPVDVLMKSIKRDIRNLNQVYDFLFTPRKRIVEIRLASNAVPIIYYFHCMDNYEAFAEELIEFAESNKFNIKVLPWDTTTEQTIVTLPQKGEQ